MRVLFVTTRQWNPGDEFIHMGVQNILSQLNIQPTVTTIYNKSPQVVSLFDKYNFWKKDYMTSRLSNLDFAINITQYDNSIKVGSDIDLYDLVVFSGSPAWFGGRLTSLYSKLTKFRGKIVFLGIGKTNKALKLSSNEVIVLRKSLVTCRNVSLVADLKRFGIKAHYLPCPALFSSGEASKTVEKINKIGLGFNSVRTHRYQSINPKKFELQSTIFETMIKKHDCKIICHYVDELEHAANLYGKDNIVYSYESQKYIEIYSMFDYVISSRVHGCGMSSSLTIPNSAITHDNRGDTVDGFMSQKLEVDNFRRILESENFEEDALLWREKIITQKKNTLTAYKELLGKYL